MPMPGQDVHLRDYLKVISKRRGIVLIFFAATVSVVMLGTFAATPQYEGSTKVLIERGDSGDLTGRLRMTPSDPEFYQTQLQLIKSRAVARRVVEMLGLKEGYAETVAGQSLLQPIKSAAGKVFRAVKSLFGGKAAGGGSQQERSWEDQAAEAISWNIKVSPVAESHILNISYTSPDPAFAALVANTTARAFIEETLNMKMDSSRRTMDWMTKKAQTEREKLEKSEQALQAYMQANGIVTLENRIAVTPEKLSELSTQLVRAESRRKELEALYAKVERVAGDPRAAETVAAIASDPTLQTLRSQIVETEKMVMELTNKFGPKHPVMVKVAGDLNVLQDKRRQEIRRIVQSIRNDYELALSNENSLRSQLNYTKSETLQLNERFIRYGALKREVDTSRQMYDALMLKLKEQSITGENQPVNLWIVEEAAIPKAPASPRKGLNTLLGLILGLVGGCGLAFLVDYLDNKIKDPDETELVLESPVLSVIPLCKENEKDIEGIVLKQPLSAFAENYKTLRSALLLSSAEVPPRKILITSAVMGEGKTTTAVNLAMALAQTEKRVVLLDGDLRKPRIHKIFKTPNDVGLSTYLAGASTGGILRKGPLPNLSIITAGPNPPNPSDLITSQRMQDLLEFLSDKFDFIICDSPPVLVVADARVLSRNFDGTILVTKAHQTTHEMATRAIKTLRDLNARVLGLVINGMDPKHNEYYYGEYHSSSSVAEKASTRAALIGNAQAKSE